MADTPADTPTSANTPALEDNPDPQTTGNGEDVEMEADADAETQPAEDAAPTDPASAPQETQQEDPSDGPQPPPETRISQKRELTLREFLGKMDDYAPIIPDTLTSHYLTLAGLPPPPQTPLPLARLLALATQKFIADIAADSYQYARIRSGHTTSNTSAALAAAAGGGAAANVPGPGNPTGAPTVPTAGAAGAAGGKAANIGTQRPGFGPGGGGGGAGGGAGGAGAQAQQGRTVLTMEDLGMAVGEYGVNVKRGEFYR